MMAAILGPHGPAALDRKGRGGLHNRLAPTLVVKAR